MHYVMHEIKRDYLHQCQIRDIFIFRNWKCSYYVKNVNLLLLSNFQPQHDLCHLLEGLNEYKGLLTTFPDILLVYRVCIFYVIIGLHSY